MIEEKVIDENLLHLENVLLDLDNYRFDKEINSLLIELKSLCDKKLFSVFENNNTDKELISSEIIMRMQYDT